MSIPYSESIAYLRPNLTSEWHPTKNGDLTPSGLVPGSGKKVWWMCEGKHEWQASIYSRVSGKGCPYCARLYVTHETSLAVTHPELAKEWHTEKNGELTVHDILSGSDKKVWWKASCGHEWETAVYNRTKENGSKCPYCFGIGGAKKINETNNFAVLYPKIAQEWHPKNKTSPQDYSPGSGERVWWKASCGHEWEATISKRTNGRGCPYCTGRKVGKTNSLVAINPTLAAEWHPTLNNNLTAENVTAGSGKKVWWKCGTCNYEWEAFINNRNRGRGCPRCAGKVAYKDKGTLKTLPFLN